MKQVIVLCSLLSCLCTSAVASITLHDVEKRVAFDGANTVVAITAGVTSTSNPGYYALHYSTDFGKTWQNVTSGDEECVLGWYRDAHGDTYESFNSIRYVAGKFYAVGARRRVCSSIDGRDNWVLDKLQNWDGGADTDNLADIAVGDVDGKRVWVVIGSNGSIYRRDESTATWTAYFKPDDTIDFQHVVYADTREGPTFVANSSETLWSSRDGKTWKKISIDDTNFQLGYYGLRFEPTKKIFIVLTMLKDGDRLAPLVLSSKDGDNWQLGKVGSNLAAMHSFEDIVFDTDWYTFVAVGAQIFGSYSQGDTQTSDNAVDSWTPFGDDPLPPVMNTVIYATKTKQMIATSMKGVGGSIGNFTPLGIMTRTWKQTQWMPATLDSSGNCASFRPSLDLLSKPLVITDKDGEEHFLATPYYPDGCAYWADSPDVWKASDYVWNQKSGDLID